jgi:DNA primase
MNSDVEEIKSRINIVELIGEYIRVTKAGSNWRALCPFHNEKSPSFMISDERKSYHCFGCGKGGDAFSFVMEMEGIGFREALEQLAQKAGVQLRKFEGKNTREDGVKPKLYSILDLATKWYEKNLWEGKGKENILDYLRNRGLADGTIRKFRLGYAPDGWRNVLDFLLKRNFKIEEIAKTGLLVEKDSKGEIPDTKYKLPATRYYDRFRDRIVFPVQDIMGRVVGFSARVAPGGNEKNAKYINTPQTDLYDKSNVLYGLYLAKTEIKKKDEVILVEGNTDVIASHQAGLFNTVAVSGTALTAEQIKIIKRYTNNIKMAFDMDLAGQSAAKRSAKVCLENDLDVRIVLLPSGKDAADVIRENKKIWEKSVGKAEGVLDYYFKDVFSSFDAKNPTDKKKIAKILLNIIKDIASPIEQSHWLKILADKLDTDEKVLAEILRKTEKKESPVYRGEEVAKEETSTGNFLEKRALGLILAFPKESRKNLERMRQEDFFGAREKTVLEVIISNKEDYSLDKIKKLLSDYETQKLLDEAVFEIEVEADASGEEKRFFDPAEELGQCLKRLRRQRLKAKISHITRELKEAEKMGDRELVKALMGEFRNLAEQIGG